MKRLTSIFLVIAMLAILSGCVASKDDIVDDLSERIEKLGFTVLEHVGNAYSSNYFIVYDNKTCVVYYYMSSYNGYFTLCPRYDNNGEVMIYGGN